MSVYEDPGGHPSPWALSDYSQVTGPSRYYSGSDGKETAVQKPCTQKTQVKEKIHPHLEYLKLWSGYPKEFLSSGVKNLLEAAGK